jgi:hypothetical protein
MRPVRHVGALAIGLQLLGCHSASMSVGDAGNDDLAIEAECSLEEALRTIEVSAPAGVGDAAPGPFEAGRPCTTSQDGAANTIFLPHVGSQPGAVTVYRLTASHDIRTNITIVGEADDRVRVEGISATSIFDVLPEGSLTLQSLTAREISGHGRIIANHGYLQLRTVTLENSGSDELDGGALFNAGRAEIFDATFQHNRGGHGGALFNGSGSNLDIFWSTFWDNTAINGGAICNGKLDKDGNHLDVGGPIRIHSSTVTQNIARAIEGDLSSGLGGGFFGITYLDLHYCTVVFNEARVTGGVYAFNNSETRTNGSIVANNTGINPDYMGDPHGEGIDDAPCLFSNEMGIEHVPGHIIDDSFHGDPKFVDDGGKANLHGLKRNGGTNHSATHAIDATSDAYAKITCPSADPNDNFYWDQRHLPRAIGSPPRLCDQGAFAYQGP